MLVKQKIKVVSYVFANGDFRKKKMAGVAGLEPTHAGFRDPCLTNLAIPLSNEGYDTINLTACQECAAKNLRLSKRKFIFINRLSANAPMIHERLLSNFPLKSRSSNLPTAPSNTNAEIKTLVSSIIFINFAFSGENPPYPATFRPRRHSFYRRQT